MEGPEADRVLAEVLRSGTQGTAVGSAMAMLVFYINRAGTNLDDEQRRVLERAKVELRTLYGKDT